jgi:hypothetical protein
VFSVVKSFVLVVKAGDLNSGFWLDTAVNDCIQINFKVPNTISGSKLEITN